jgi:hypothetical protein
VNIEGLEDKVGEYLAMQEDGRELMALRKAVLAYLDDFYKADEDGDRIPWPQELEELTGWKPSSAI